MQEFSWLAHDDVVKAESRRTGAHRDFAKYLNPMAAFAPDLEKPPYRWK